ncbi:MAG: leucyl aminopeptidase [Myxococcaceae bacterium]
MPSPAPVVSLATASVLRLDADVLVLPVLESDGKAAADAAMMDVDRALGGHLHRAAFADGFKGRAEQLFAFHTQGRIPAARVVLVGLGPKERCTPEHLRQAAGRAVRAALRGKAMQVLLSVPTTGDDAGALRAATEGALLGAYRFDRYRTNGAEERGTLGSLRVTLPPGVRRTDALEEALQLAVQVAMATNHARDLVNEPAAHLTPERLAEEARRLAKACGLKVRVDGPEELARLKMGMFLAVGQGSANPPRLIELDYLPKGKAASARPLVLVGKAITFDSGGLSLKPADGMLEMKTDMAGAAALMGVMQVVAALKPPFPVVALLGAAENMPSGTAYRPGDVLTSRLGKTVEVSNTDAEGRLVLGDVLAYAAERAPAALLDVATLTGACVVALGQHVVGLWSTDDALADAVVQASRRAGEAMWRMPLVELQKENLRSEVADMKNAGERQGAAIAAALFLREFVGAVPWVHLDIAGPSVSSKERGYFVKGATGVTVRTLVELIRSRAQAALAAAPPRPRAPL